MTLTAALAVVLTSTVLFPAFQDSTWFYEGIGAVLVVAAAGTLSRLRTLPVTLCLLISLIALVLYLNLLLESGHSYGGIVPSSGSMAGLWHLADAGFSDANKFSAPAPDVAGLKLLATAGIGITAVLTDLIAVRLRAAAMAGLPLLMLFTIPVAFNGNRSSITITVIFALATIGYLALLSADGRERIRVWGRLISLWRTHDADTADSADEAAAASGPAPATRSPYRVLRGPDTRGLAAAGRRVGIASIVLALCTPLLIPGLHDARLTSSDLVFGTGGNDGTSTTAGLYDPLAAATEQLREAKPYTVLTYTTNASAALQTAYPQYLQQYVYTTLTDNNGWVLPFSTQTTTAPVNTDLPAQEPKIPAADAPQVQTVISIRAKASLPNAVVNLLPVPYPALRFYPSAGSWYYDPTTLMLLTQHTSLDGMNYRVVSQDVDPPASQLDRAPAAPAMAADTQLPASYRDSTALQEFVQKITAGQKTEYGKVSAITQWLHQSGAYIYDTYSPSIVNVADLLNYLTKSKAGDCVQAAYAMTVLVRMLGIPARMAVGYTQGSTSNQVPGATYVVKSNDMHAWPEVFFTGYGWMRFEPTPPGGGGTASTPGYSTKPGSVSTSPVSQPTAAAGQNLKNLGGHIRKPDGGNDGAGAGPAVPLAAKKTPAGTPWLALALAVLAAIGLACGVISALAPMGQRALSARQITVPRQRLSLGTALTVLAVAGVIALALYRLLSHTKGLSLGNGWATVGIAFGAACAAALIVPVTWRLAARRWRWIRASDNDADLAHAAWEELRADLADYGVGYLPSESPRALAGRVATGLALAEPAVAAVGRIALAEERATYAGRPGDAEGLRKDGSTARRGIAEAAGRTARWRARLFPASTMATIADLAAKVPETWATRIRPRLFRRSAGTGLDG